MTGGVLKLLIFILLSLFAILLLKKQSSEYAFFISLAAGCTAMFFVLSVLKGGIDSVKAEIEDLGVNTQYFVIALKAVGIGYITSFVADACRDAGQSALASKAELAGKGAIFVLSIPMITGILRTAVGFING